MTMTLVSTVDLHDIDSFITDTDLPFEYELDKDPSLTNWLRYYWNKDTIEQKLFVLQRACYALPRSYKLWMLYLNYRVEIVDGINPVSYQDQFLSINMEFEKALELLMKMPILWEKYLVFLMRQSDVTLILRKFNEALRQLPISQHERIWPLFIEFADQTQGTIGSNIYLRYLKFAPDDLELVFEKLITFSDVKHSFAVFDQLIALRSKSLDIWLNFIDFLIEKDYADEVTVENLIRSGIEKFPDQVGKLFMKLGNYFIQRQDYLRARMTFQEGIAKALTIKDFTDVYESFAEFEEHEITQLMSQAEDNPDISRELDFRLAKFERLMDSRSFLISDIRLKQSPNDVEEWLHRISLFKPINLKGILQTYVKGITTIDPQLSTPGLSKLWIGYSRVYEDNNDLKTARTIFDKAIKVPFNSPGELINIWIEWAELELRQDNIDLAIRVMEVATKYPQGSKIDFNDNSLPVQARIHKSIKLWSFYLDLVESGGDVDATCSIYEKLFELKIATPLTVINYANFLEDQSRFEQAFKIYERGVSIFHYPVVFEIWNIYLTKAIKRQLPLERIRDLFDQSLEGCPPDLCKSIFILYANYELENGSTTRAVKILKQAISYAVVTDKVELFELLIHLTINQFGLISSRDIFQQAIDSLPANLAVPFVLEFASVEVQLKEFERVRGLLRYGGLLQPIARNTALWEFWSNFELENGNKETYKELLKTKRQAEEKFFVDTESLGFVKSSTGPKVSSIDASKEATDANPDAIELDLDI